MARRRVSLIAALLFLAGFFNDPPWKGYGKQEFFYIQSEPLRVGLNIAHTGEFANPFAILPTGPTAHTAPAYPYLIAGIVKWFGEGPNAWLAIRLLATTALSLQFALLPWAAKRLGFSLWTGALAALFGILVKPAKEEMWEAHLVGLLILLLVITSERKAALLAGLSLLLQPVLAAAYYAWTLPRRRWLLALVPLAICLPWIVRNFVVLEAPTFIRDDLGIELAVSFNDCTPYGIRESERTGCFLAQHPNTSIAQATRLREIGEYRYNQERLREGLAWISEHPTRAIGLIAQRAWFFWFPSDAGFSHYAQQRKRMWAGHLFTVLSFAGVYLIWRRGKARVLLLWLGVFPLIYYLMQFEERYRYPILWITWLLAAYLFEPLYSRRHDHTAQLHHD